MKKMITLAMATCLLMGFASCGAGNGAQHDNACVDSTLLTSIPQFDADSAYAYAEAQCAMGPRVPGTAAHSQCLNWLVDKLDQCADSVIVQQGAVTTFDGTQLTAHNIIAQFNPAAEGRVLLLAHWDCRPWADQDPDPARRREPVMGANDGASGTAVLLEIARQLNTTRPTVGVDILLVDVEDWGDSNNDDSWALGTKYWARHPHVEGYKAMYGILLDMVGARAAQFAPEYFSITHAPGIVQRVWNEAIASGYGSHFKNDGGGAVTDDHIAVNEMGIPCIDIIDMRQGGKHGFFDAWHTTHDTMDNIDRITLRAVGQTVINVLYK